MQEAAAFVHRRFEAVHLAVAGQHLIFQPFGQRLAILYGGFPKSQPAPNLGTVVFDGAPSPFIVGPLGGLDPDLRGDVPNYALWDLLRMPRKATLSLKEFEQDGKTQTRRASLIPQQTLLARQKAPLRRQLFGGPIAFHGAPPSWNGSCKVGTRSIAFRRMMERRSNSA
jgi:hypothetical protein